MSISLQLTKPQVSEQFEFNVKQFIIDENEGNFVVLDLEIQEHVYTIVNMYGPNIDNPDFFQELKEILIKLESNRIILCGDWNLIMDIDLDKFNYKHIANPKARKKVFEIIDLLDLKDPWRESNPYTRCFTWGQPNAIKD